jgi:hypothetical protein
MPFQPAWLSLAENLLVLSYDDWVFLQALIFYLRAPTKRDAANPFEIYAVNMQQKQVV